MSGPCDKSIFVSDVELVEDAVEVLGAFVQEEFVERTTVDE